MNMKNLNVGDTVISKGNVLGAGTIIKVLRTRYSVRYQVDAGFGLEIWNASDIHAADRAFQAGDVVKNQYGEVLKVASVVGVQVFVADGSWYHPTKLQLVK